MTIKERIAKLTAEGTKILQDRAGLLEQVNKLNVRIAEIQGALTELQEVEKDDEKTS